jgi:hypothetical protein
VFDGSFDEGVEKAGSWRVWIFNTAEMDFDRSGLVTPGRWWKTLGPTGTRRHQVGAIQSQSQGSERVLQWKGDLMVAMGNQGHKKWW